VVAINFHQIHGVSGDGWGLWKTLTSPNKTTATLLPVLSLTSPPSS